jgi:4'-phosphopantetheinyl transferase
MNAIFRMRPDDVHVWHAPVNIPPAAIEDAQRLLSPDERARANRFRFDRDRVRYVATRAILRRLLAHYTDRPPQDLAFDVSPHGKPALRGADWLKFNVAHSHELALFAFARLRSIGIDVEWNRHLDDLLAVARSFCSPVEYATLCGLPADLRLAAFYRCWTRKEAYVKARGEGFSLDPRNFSVTPLREQGGHVAIEADRLEEGRRWRLEDVRTSAGYSAAFAVEDGFNEVHHFEWSNRLQYGSGRSLSNALRGP